MKNLSLIRILLLTLLCALLLTGTLTYGQEATETPTEEASAEATAAPTEEATAEATSTPISEATEIPTEEATAEAAAEVTAVPTEEAAEPPAEVPTGGVTTLVLLMGLGAVVAVGGLMITRNNFNQNPK